MTVILPTVIIALLYVSACIVHIIRIRHIYKFNDLLGPNSDFKEKARAAIAVLWDCHGWIWHGYEIVGIEKIPPGPSLIVYYHGTVPVDYYYLNARFYIKTAKTMWTIAADFLFKTPGLKLMMEVIRATPGTVQQIADLLKRGETVTVSPGGVREAQFSSEYYDLIWNGHIGFAKAACLGKAPIVPMFTQNIREAYRTVPICRGFFRKLYERVKLPLLFVYGGFPVKLRTYIGDPIPYDEKATPEEVAERTAEALRNLINTHQRLPGSIVGALLDRLRQPIDHESDLKPESKKC